MVAGSIQRIIRNFMDKFHVGYFCMFTPTNSHACGMLQSPCSSQGSTISRTRTITCVPCKIYVSLRHLMKDSIPLSVFGYRLCFQPRLENSECRHSASTSGRRINYTNNHRRGSGKLSIPSLTDAGRTVRQPPILPFLWHARVAEANAAIIILISTKISAVASKTLFRAITLSIMHNKG